MHYTNTVYTIRKEVSSAFPNRRAGGHIHDNENKARLFYD